jgi:hypothetical protein
VVEVVLVRRFSTLKRGPTSRARTATALAAVGALVMSGGLLLLAAPTASAGGQDHVFVCKYVGKPGVDEVLKSGEQPIRVAVSSIEHNQWDGTVPGYFSDAQDRSYVLDWSTDLNTGRGNEYTGDKTCPAPDHPTIVPVPAQPSTTDPCGPRNISFVVPEDTTSLDWTLLPNGNVTVVPKAGYRFDQESQSVTFVLPADSNVPCSTTVTIDPPGAPGTTDPCGPANISFNVPADTTQLDYTLLGNGNVTVSPQPGYVFSGASQLITFTLPADSGVPCPLGVEEIAPVVTFTDPDCADLDGADWSGNLTDVVDYQVTGTPDLGESVTVTATVKPAMADEFAFPEGFDNTFDHTYPTVAELDCVLGEESVVPTPKPEQNPPVVLGTEAAVPTQVHAGMATLPTTGGPTNALLGQLLVAGGLLLLVAGGWVGAGTRAVGKHHV